MYDGPRRRYVTSPRLGVMQFKMTKPLQEKLINFFNKEIPHLKRFSRILTTKIKYSISSRQSLMENFSFRNFTEEEEIVRKGLAITICPASLEIHRLCPRQAMLLNCNPMNSCISERLTQAGLSRLVCLLFTCTGWAQSTVGGRLLFNGPPCSIYANLLQIILVV